MLKVAWALASDLFRRIPREVWIALAILAAIFFAAKFVYGQGVEAGIAKQAVRTRAEIAAHRQTKANFTAAQDQAAKMQRDAVDAEKARQERISDEVRKDYQQRLAAIRSRADRVRIEAGARASGASDQVRVPAFAEAPRRADGAPDCNAVFAGYVAGQFPALETRIQCAERAEKEALDHDALIGWLEAARGGE